MNNQLESLMKTAMDKIHEMSNVNTVVGDPITAPDGTILIPISKVGMGFGTGGSDFPGKNQKDLFGGGSGAGISIQPIAFLVMRPDGDIRMMSIPTSDNSVDRLINMAPNLIDQVNGFIQKRKANADAHAETADPLPTESDLA